MKRFFLLFSILLVQYVSLQAQTVFTANDIAYIYDSSASDFEGLEADSLYALVCRFAPKTLNVVPIETDFIIEHGVDELKIHDCHMIVISGVGEDREEDEEFKKYLSKLDVKNHILCFNPSYLSFWGKRSWTSEYTVKVYRNVPQRQIYMLLPIAAQHMIFDDVLADMDGNVSLYDSSVQGLLNPIKINYKDQYTVSGYESYAHAPIDQDGQQCLILEAKRYFLYVGLSQQCIKYLTPAGKNLIENCMKYLETDEYDNEQRKPYMMNFKINNMPVSADFMAELSSGHAHYVVPSIYNEFRCSVETFYRWGWMGYSLEIDYNDEEKYAMINYSFNLGNDETGETSYRIDYVYENAVSIEDIKHCDDASVSYDLLGRKMTGDQKGLRIEAGKVIWK